MAQMLLVQIPLARAEAHRFETYAGLCAIMLMFLVSVLVPPFEQNRFTICLFKNLTGVPCPSCGMTRAFLFLGHGQILKASTLNPLALPLALAFLLQGARLWLRLATLHDYRLQLSPLLWRSAIAVAVTVSLGIWLFRIL